MRKWSNFFLMAGVSVTLGVNATANALTITDEFNATSLDPMWLMEKDPVDGGAFSTPGGHIRFDGMGNNAYGHIQTTATYDTTGGLRADAIIRQDHYGVQTWGAGVAIYFDANNYVALKQSAAGGASGWLRHVVVNGVLADAADLGDQVSDLYGYWLIGGVELTPTQMKFYGSQILPKIDQFGNTNIDASMSEIPGLGALPRPASFTGNATIIIGKGWDGNTWNNSAGSDMNAFMGIDYARITVTAVPEPSSLALAGLGLLALRRKRS